MTRRTAGKFNMPSSHLLDRRLFCARLRRAAANTDRSALFLLDHVVEDAIERLQLVNRKFRTAIDVAGWEPELCARLRKRGIAANTCRLAPFVARGTPDAIIDDECLPLRAASADLVVSALSLQFANDLPGILSQIRRVLEPDGLFLAALIGGESLHELRTCLAEAELEISGGLSPRILPFAEIRDIGALLQRAGFALPVTDRDRLTVRYSSMLALANDLRAMAATNILHDRHSTVPPRMLFPRAAQIYSEKFADPDGKIRATFDIIWLSGWAPHESQQQPLKPGSAKTSLADALGTTEIGSESKT